MNPAEMLLLGLAVAGSAWAATRFFQATRKDRETRRRQALGVHNAEEEARARGEICVVCGEPVDPAADLYDQPTTSWWHRACWREALK
jgi:hypothetical protein